MNMMKNTEIAALRREYLLKELDEGKVNPDPFGQFSVWMEEAINSGLLDPSAMVLATADSKGIPSVRTVLLKEADSDGFVFYTNYSSRKGKDLDENPNAALLFLWRELERQIRISGRVEKVSKRQSEEYFHSRPYDSQIGAAASDQSSIIPGRGYLEKRFGDLKQKFDGQNIPLPEFWGGYKLYPVSFEFWQGRESRLHDRVCYLKEKEGWKIVRLAP